MRCRIIMMMMITMMTVDLYSALRRAPLPCYMSRCIVKRNVFSADLKDPMLSDGSRRWSGSRFQTIGPATENARRPNLLWRWRGTISWWRVADRRCERLAIIPLDVFLIAARGKVHLAYSITVVFLWVISMTSNQSCFTGLFWQVVVLLIASWLTTNKDSYCLFWQNTVYRVSYYQVIQ